MRSQPNSNERWHVHAFSRRSGVGGGYSKVERWSTVYRSGGGGHGNVIYWPWAQNEGMIMYCGVYGDETNFVG